MNHKRARISSDSSSSSGDSFFKKEKFIVRPDFVIAVPSMKNDYDSEADTCNSYQLYETDYVRNSPDNMLQIYSSDSDDGVVDVEWEEFESLDTDNSYCSIISDADSSLEDVAISSALILETALEADREEELFWADSSDQTDTTIVDLELTEEDKWFCVKCHSKNHPYISYCNACWQIRKSWLPDPPKRKKRKKLKPSEERNHVQNFNPSVKNDLCCLCYVRPNDYTLVHGSTGHQCICLPCSERIFAGAIQQRRCPVCRKKIHKVIKNILCT